MTLALVFLLVLLTVPLAGGRLGRLAELELRWVWLAWLALAIQLVIVILAPEGNEGLHRAAHLGSYALAGACVARNLHLRFAWLVAVGGLLNVLAIAANGGVMPASGAALEVAGLEAESTAFANSNPVPHAALAPLGDVFAIPAGWPGANVFSVGDVLIAAGALLALHAASGSRLRAPRRRARAPDR